jgi:hypothetical protein
MNYLQLCQRTASESGTISGDTAPTTTVGQSGRLLKVVNWVPTAWQQIQNLHDDWTWMRAEWTGTLTANAPKYTAASWNLDRWGQWITLPETVTIYDPAIGLGDEGCLRNITWQEWRTRYGRGLQISNRPREYAVSPAGEMCFGPIPDRAYVARGEMQKNAQSLLLNTDIPELPDTSLHTVIVWKALLLLAQFDEGAWETSVATVRCQDDLRSMQKYRPKPFVDYGGGASIA